MASLPEPRDIFLKLLMRGIQKPSIFSVLICHLLEGPWILWLRKSSARLPLRKETRLESVIHWAGVSVSWPRLRNRIYSNMILLDPPIFSPLKRSAIRWLRRLGILEWFSPSRRVLRRRNTFASRDQALEYFAAKPLFKDFPKYSLEIYIEEGLSPAQNGFQLRIPREREAEIYDSIPDRLPETIYAGRGVLIYSQKMEVLKHLDLQW